MSNSFNARSDLKVGGTLGMAYEDPTPLFFAVHKD